jgi:hypothetical protein
MVAHVAIFILFSTIMLTESQLYLTKYKTSVIFFKKLSDIGFFLPYMMFTRDLLYNRTTYVFNLTG